jgi:hypothetical protein
MVKLSADMQSFFFAGSYTSVRQRGSMVEQYNETVICDGAYGATNWTLSRSDQCVSEC